MNTKPEPWWACCIKNEINGSHYVFEGNSERAICKMLCNDPSLKGYDPMVPTLSVKEKNQNAERIALSVTLLKDTPLEELRELVKEKYKDDPSVMELFQ
jgi:hypothetical protein